MSDLQEPFKVFVRVRPFLENEIESLPISTKLNLGNYLSVSDREIKVTEPSSIDMYLRKDKSFKLDGTFTEINDNENIFGMVIKPLVENVVQGINATVMAYGVTGTGKTHTIFGDIYEEINFEKGICILAVEYLFKLLKTCKDETTSRIRVSYLEIYNEQVIDLLSSSTNSQFANMFSLGSAVLAKKEIEPLMIVEDSQKGVFVPNLTEHEVDDPEQIVNLLLRGNQKRTMAPTGNNKFSSRSHAIFQIILERKSEKSSLFSNQVSISKFLVVDLAGSERGGLEKGIRTHEGSNINKSLLALGNCINILSDTSKTGSFVPYRDSKLTRLLKDSLGGNISTVMISCISPNPQVYEETINTLKYATRARSIEKKIFKNIREVDLHIYQYKEIIESLKKEVEQLKKIIKQYQSDIGYPKGNERFERKHTHRKSNESIDRFKTNQICNELIGNELQNITQSLRMDPNQESSIACLKYENSDSYLEKNYIEELLSMNINELDVKSLETLDKKIEAISIYKQQLEKRIREEYLDPNSNRVESYQNQYQYVAYFYDKFSDLLSNQLVENLEKNLVISCNLKDIHDLNDYNKEEIEKIQIQLGQLEINDTLNNCSNDKDRLIEKKSTLLSNIQENDSIAKQIEETLNTNLSIKNYIKSSLSKVNSNSELSNANSLQMTILKIQADKRELDSKNKKYREYILKLTSQREDFQMTISKQNQEILQKDYQIKCKEETILKLYKELDTYKDSVLGLETEIRLLKKNKEQPEISFDFNSDERMKANKLHLTTPISVFVDLSCENAQLTRECRQKCNSNIIAESSMNNQKIPGSGKLLKQISETKITSTLKGSNNPSQSFIQSYKSNQSNLLIDLHTETIQKRKSNKHPSFTLSNMSSTFKMMATKSPDAFKKESLNSDVNVTKQLFIKQKYFMSEHWNKSSAPPINKQNSSHKSPVIKYKSCSKSKQPVSTGVGNSNNINFNYTDNYEEVSVSAVDTKSEAGGNISEIKDMSQILDMGTKRDYDLICFNDNMKGGYFSENMNNHGYQSSLNKELSITNLTQQGHQELEGSPSLRNINDFIEDYLKNEN